MSRRLISALIVAVACIGVSAATVSAQGSPTCVEANDIRESAAGNFQNVGVYQRTYSPAILADAYCRQDHGDGPWSPTTGQPLSSLTPPPAATPAPTPHPVSGLVKEVALARGATPSQAQAIVADVVAQNTVGAFLQGELDNVIYGRYPCQWKSAACPLGQESPPPAPAPPAPVQQAGYWDPRLRRAANLLLHGIQVEILWPNLVRDSAELEGLRVVFGPVRPGLFGTYSFSAHTVTINERHRNARPVSLAAMLAHELTHVVMRHGSFRPTYEECIQQETWAYNIQGVAWFSLHWPNWKGFPQTSLERLHADLAAANRAGARPSAEDIAREVYHEHCSRF